MVIDIIRNRWLWKMLDESIKSVVDKVTLEDLLEWQEEVGSDYVI